MCGIVGFCGTAPALPCLLDGLARLEYRGYDSAGVATVADGVLHRVRAVGKLQALLDAATPEAAPGATGIGHTRWATHGAPTQANAHPHVDASGRIALVHNGIIENFRNLRARLEEDGVAFASETDSEVLAQCIGRHYAGDCAGDLAGAVAAALAEAEGAYAILVAASDAPGTLVAARRGSPLLLAQTDRAWLVASDVPAVLPHSRQVVYLEEGDLATLTPDGYRVQTTTGEPVERPVTEITWRAEAAEKEGFAHFMLKEIHQQPDVLRHLLVSYTQDGAVVLPELGFGAVDWAGVRRIVLVACGTAWHAGLVARYYFEQFARVPAEVDFASEFRYRQPVVDADTLVVAISQSGETADTLEAVRLAKRAGARVVAAVNVQGSSIARLADGLVYTQAGPEIGVASTKAYTAQVAALALLAVHAGQSRGTLTAEQMAAHLKTLAAVPAAMEQCLARAATVQACAALPKYRDVRHAMFIGRTFNYPSALEGALKLKEISYIHVEGYGAGEMKHGPIALVTDHLPVVAIAVQGAVYQKVLGNIEEIRARGGIVLGIGTEGDTQLPKLCDDLIEVPACDEAFSPLVVAIPLQLFAYHVAVNLGRDADQPRNLAKSVTVE